MDRLELRVHKGRLDERGEGSRRRWPRRRGQGNATEIPLPEPGNYEDPTFSPDGRRIAVSIGSPPDSYQIWIWDRDQRTQQLLTVEGEQNRRPVWSPDGTRIAFGRETEQSTFPQIYWQPADGSGAAERLLETEGGAVPHQFSAGGDSLLIVTWTQTTEENIGLLSLADGTIRWLVPRSRSSVTMVGNISATPPQ